jgi:hypothetical protein
MHRIPFPTHLRSSNPRPTLLLVAASLRQPPLPGAARGTFGLVLSSRTPLVLMSCLFQPLRLRLPCSELRHFWVRFLKQARQLVISLSALRLKSSSVVLSSVHWEFFFFPKCLDWRRSIYSFNIDLGVDALGSLLPHIIISSTFGSCALDSCGYCVHPWASIASD